MLNRGGFGMGSSSSSSPFGASNTNTSGGLFGSNANPGGQPRAATSGFGGFGATSTPAASPFGANANANNTNAASTGFGGFGSASVSPVSTAPGSVSTGVGANSGQGTGLVPYNAYSEKDAQKPQNQNVFVNINAMPQYENFSLSELRFQDYQQGRRYGNGGAGGAVPASTSAPNSPFGTNNNSGSTGFGSTAATSPFGQNNNSGGLLGKPAGNSMFGSNSMPTTANNTSPFGAATNQSQASPFSFGQANSGTGSVNAFGASPGNTLNAAKPFGSTTTFGASPTNTATPAFGTPTNASNNLFGSNNNNTAATPAFGGGFGQSAPANGAANANNATGSTGFGFGSTVNNSTSTGSTFGSLNASKPTNSLFGGTATTSSAPSPFGATTTTNSTAGAFGKPAANNSLQFGSTSNSSPASGGLFGTPGTSATPSASQPRSFSAGFGTANSNSSPAATFGGFGAANNTSNTNNTNTSSPFGGLSSGAPAASSPFGSAANSATTQPSSGGLFGSAPAAGSGGLFGSNTTNTAQNTSTGGSLFGGFNNNNAASTNKPSLFGTTNATTAAKPGGLFGNGSSNTNSSPFGGLNTSSNTPNNSNTSFGAAPSFSNSLGFGNSLNNSTNGSNGNSVYGTKVAQIDQTPYSSSILFPGQPTVVSSGSVSQPMVVSLSNSQQSRPSSPSVGSSHRAPLASSNSPGYSYIRKGAFFKPGRKHTWNDENTSATTYDDKTVVVTYSNETSNTPSKNGKNKYVDISQKDESPSSTSNGPLLLSKLRQAVEVPVPSSAASFDRSALVRSTAFSPKSSIRRLIIEKTLNNAEVSLLGESKDKSFNESFGSEDPKSTSGPMLLENSANNDGSAIGGSPSPPSASTAYPNSATTAASAASLAFRTDTTTPPPPDSSSNGELKACVDVPRADYDIVDEEGYWMSPSNEKLKHMSLKELRNVEKFTIGRKGFGEMTFLEPVDLSSYSDVGAQIPGRDLVISNRQIAVYPDLSVRPPPGEGINVKGQLTLYNIWPRLKDTGEYVKDENHPLLKKFIQHLKGSKNSEFVSYTPATGKLVTIIPSSS